MLIDFWILSLLKTIDNASFLKAKQKIYTSREQMSSQQH